MGATTFITVIKEDVSATMAFQAAVQNARHEYGHGGYTGTIGEKSLYTMIQEEPMELPDARILAERLIDEDDPRISDKWGPAGCIPLKPHGHLFFGWASE